MILKKSQFRNVDHKYIYRVIIKTKKKPKNACMCTCMGLKPNKHSQAVVFNNTLIINDQQFEIEYLLKCHKK